MITYFDTSAILEAILGNQKAAAVILKAGDGRTCCHALAECFSTLTGRLKMPADIADKLIHAWCYQQLTLEVCLVEDYRAITKNAKTAGVRGGAVFDALHLQVANRLNSEVIYTRNVTDFLQIWRGDPAAIQDPCIE